MTAAQSNEGVGREAGFYWVKWSPDHWDISELDGHARWWLIGDNRPTQSKPHTIGPRITPPQEREA